MIEPQKICILETGEPRDALERQYGSYPMMAQDLLSPYMPDAEFTTVSPTLGEALPQPQGHDGYVIMGSKHGVYDDLPWIEPLKAFIREVAARKIPLVGICFGHQIMAEALGGKVEVARQGWQVGVQEYAMPGTEVTVKCMAFHQDQVVRQPDDTEVILCNDSCAYGGLVYSAFPGLSVQPHPEFDAAFVSELLHDTRENPIDADIVDYALCKIATPTNRTGFAKAIAAVLSGSLSPSEWTGYLPACLGDTEPPRP